MFKFYLDNNEVSDPVNWEDFTETLEYDDTIKGVLPKYELKLNFVGGGYEYLYSKRVDAGFCQLIELKVMFACSDGTFKPLLEGYINIARCKFNLNKCYVECDILDNNFGALIYNNKSIKANLGSSKSKTGVTIASPLINALVFYDFDINGYPPTSDARDCVSIYEAFKFLIAFMTDGKVGFESDYFNDLTGNYNKQNINSFQVSTFILTGKKIRLNSVDDFPEISFEELFTEANKKYNIAFTIVDRNGIPTMKIEDRNFFFSNGASGLSIENIEDFKESFNPEKLYSGIKFGSKTTDIDVTLHSFTPKQFQSFNEEQYYFQNQCNLDKTLDLVGDWIVDTNIIEEIKWTDNTNTSYDTDIFFVEGLYDGITNFTYTFMNDAYTNALVFNYHLLNQQVAARFEVYGDTTLFLGDNLLEFRASRTDRNESYFVWTSQAPQPLYTYQQHYHQVNAPTNYIATEFQVYFNNDTTNPNFNNGSYDLPNGKYNVSLAGGYKFNFQANIQFFNFRFYNSYGDIVKSTELIPVGWRLTLTINRWNSSNVLVDYHEQKFPNTNGITYSDFDNRGDGIRGFNSSVYFLCDATDYITTTIYWETIRNPDLSQSSSDVLFIRDTNGSFFECIATPSGGGVFQTGDMTNYKIAKIEFEQPLSNDSYITLKSDLTKSIQVNHDGHTNKVGWIRKVTRKLASGETSWELISDLKNT